MKSPLTDCHDILYPWLDQLPLQERSIPLTGSEYGIIHRERMVAYLMLGLSVMICMIKLYNFIDPSALHDILKKKKRSPCATTHESTIER